MTIVAIKERPILFNASMVRAILDGRKTQTRRVMKIGVNQVGGPKFLFSSGQIHCPLGTVGDRLWVRETWGDRADYARISECHKSRIYYAADGRMDGWKYRPSIHMPRWASRITLEITGVRVERLQDISADDIRSEGVETPENELFPTTNRNWKLNERFTNLWESIYGKGSWEANPWLWVIEFERVQS